MKRSRRFFLFLGSGILVLSGALAGCGGSNNNVPVATQVEDLAALADECSDTCNNLVACAGLPAEVAEANLAVCNANCNSPAAEDVPVRECSNACDETADCATYMECLCDCGLDEVCPVSLASTCSDTCSALMNCVDLPPEAVEQNIAVCNANCNSPAAEDVPVRECSNACDETADCSTYMECLCDCGLDEVCS